MPVSPPSLRPELVLSPPLQACATPHCVETCLLAGGSERPLSVPSHHSHCWGPEFAGVHGAFATL